MNCSADFSPRGTSLPPGVGIDGGGGTIVPRGLKSALYFVLALPMLAGVDGVVINGTTGKPQPGIVVSLVQPMQSGMQAVANVSTDSQGKFSIGQPTDGVHLIQALHQGVPYTKMLQPGAATSGIQLEVFDATSNPAVANISQHIVFIQPSSGELSINEVYFFKNDSKQTYNSPATGTLQFFVPAPRAEASSVRVTISAPGGMPVQRPAEPTKGAGVFKVNFPVKPGETEFNVSYSMPTTDSFASRNVVKVADTRIVVPKGVSLTGDGITPQGVDPSGKVNIYSTTAQDYKVNLQGSAETGMTQGGESGGSEEETGQPRITETKPRVYEQLPVVVALASAILMLGFIVLYRAAASKGKARK